MQIDMVASGERDLAVRIDHMPELLQGKLAARFGALTSRLEQLVISRVPRRTGRLRSQIRSKLDVTPDLVRGRVFVATQSSVDHGKAGALEYSAHRRHTVREHRATLTHLWGRATSPMEVIVDRYQRTANIREHRFLRGPAATLRDEAVAAARQAIAETTK